MHFLDIVTYYANHQDDMDKSECAREVSTHFDRTRCNRLESLGLLEGLITMYPGTSTVDKYVPTNRGFYLYTIFLDEGDAEHIRIRND